MRSKQNNHGKLIDEMKNDILKEYFSKVSCWHVLTSVWVKESLQGKYNKYGELNDGIATAKVSDEKDQNVTGKKKENPCFRCKKKVH